MTTRHAARAGDRLRSLTLRLWGLSVILSIGLMALDVSRLKAEDDSLDVSVLNAPVVNMGQPPRGLVQWSAAIGTSAGPMTVNSGRVFVGTTPSRQSGLVVDHGIMACFQDRDGRLLWQVGHDRLPSRVHDMPTQAIKSQAAVDGDRAYYVSNRGELVCLQLPIRIPQDAPPEGEPLPNEDIRPLWTLDMVTELGVLKRDAGDIGNPTCSPLVGDKLVYCLTGHGSTFGNEHLFETTPVPPAPSFVAVDKLTGALVWSSAAPGDGIPYGQWASPVAIQVKGITQVIFPGGDGVLYGFHPLTGKLEWSLDCNSPTRTPWTLRSRGTRCLFVSRPTVVDGILYAALGQDLETPVDFAAPVVAVDLRPIGRREQPTLLWTHEDSKLGQMLGEVRFAENRLYGVSCSGKLVVLNAKTGEELWRTRIGESSAMFGAPCLTDKYILVNTDSELQVFTLSDRPRCLARYFFSKTVENSPVVREGTVYVTTRGHVWALKLEAVLAGPVRPEAPEARTPNRDAAGFVRIE